MKCISGPYICPKIGFSGGSPVCGVLLVQGETKFIKNGIINEPCPLPKIKYPSHCCQKCGENIGWLGRFIFPFFHKCKGLN